MNEQLLIDLNNLLNDAPEKNIAYKFKQKISNSKYTKDDDPESHLCVSFAAYDHKSKQIFIGRHIKSGLWLFNGGHVDKEETLRQAVEREINEEWEINTNNIKIGIPELLTITDIDNPTKQTCRTHFDIWYFIDIDKNNFNPDPSKLATEFYSVEWIDLIKAKELITDKSTITALDYIKTRYFN